MRLIGVFIICIVLFSCRDNLKLPGKPLMEFTFDGEITNLGLSKLDIKGDAAVSYYSDEKDTCLDLMASAEYRKPIVINYEENFSFADYDGFTISIWVQKAPNDNEDYCILSQEEQQNEKWLGWQLRAEKCGTWSWIYKDSIQNWIYKPTYQRQPINDNTWHQLAYTYDRNIQEARLYFDGINVAVYSMFGNTNNITSTPLRIGISPASTFENIDVFNGRIDDLAVWSRTLDADEIRTIYCLKQNTKIKKPVCNDQLKVMTWDVWQTGIHEGKYVGKERVLDVLKSSEADVIFLQEMAGAGSFLADGLGYYYYQRDINLGVLSKYPLLETHNVFRPQNSGCIKVDLGNERKIFACPIALNQQPRLDSYFKSEAADVDTIIYRENEFRGKEMTFILGELRHLIFTNEETPMILGGGFYSGSHLDWTDKNKDQNNGLVIDYPVTRYVERAGFKDTYRLLNPDEISERGLTWSPKLNSAFPNRIDYIYSHGDRMKPVESYVINNHLISFPSSHAAVVTVFNFTNN
nr:LamG-like jellyroll fold domain-containing protein [uncultured Carboxylicivirga sp.]